MPGRPTCEPLITAADVDYWKLLLEGSEHKVHVKNAPDQIQGRMPFFITSNHDVWKYVSPPVALVIRCSHHCHTRGCLPLLHTVRSMSSPAKQGNSIKRKGSPYKNAAKVQLEWLEKGKAYFFPTAIYDWYLTEPAHNANATWIYAYIPGYKDLFFYDTVANRDARKDFLSTGDQHYIP
jgi:hypothetical protein